MFLKKIKTELPYNLAIPFLGISPKEMKTGYQKDVCFPMFIAALFIIAKIQKHPKCPSTDKWIRVIYISYIYIYHTHTHTHTHTYTTGH